MPFRLSLGHRCPWVRRPAVWPLSRSHTLFEVTCWDPLPASRDQTHLCWPSLTKSAFWISSWASIRALISAIPTKFSASQTRRITKTKPKPQPKGITTMAILRSGDGKFYDVEDSVLEGKEVSPDKVQSLPPPQAGGAGSGLIQIVLNAPPPSGGPPNTASPAEGDVAGHHGHGGWGGGGCWNNCWYNQWHNHAWHNHGGW